MASPASRPPVALAVALALLVALAGCGRSGDEPGDGARVVATTTVVADLTSRVAEGRAEVDGLLPADADPHDYEPRPSDAAAVADADLVVRSGADLDAWLGDLVEGAGGEADVLTVLDRLPRETTPPAEEDHAGEEDGHAHEGGDDPHWWQDPRAAVEAVGLIRDALAAADPAGRPTYRRNAARLVADLRALDRDLARCYARIPPADRELVTTHDALGPLARRYGLRVVGTVIPSRSSQAQPSSRDLRDLVTTVRDLDVPAIFPETALDPRLEEAVARETGARVGGELYADALGPDGSGADTYEAAMRRNADTIVTGLTGGRARCR